MSITPQLKEYYSSFKPMFAKPIGKSRETRTVNNAKLFNIVGLINDNIKKIVFDVSNVNEVENPINIAKHLVCFVKDLFPDSYNKLSYDLISDNVFNLIYDLSEILFDNNYFLEIIDDNLSIAYTPVAFNQALYVIDAHKLCSLPNTPLKIGFAHLLNAMKTSVVCNMLDNEKLKDLESSHLENVIEINDDISEDIINEHLKTVNKTLRNYHKYSNKNIIHFYDYKPKSKANKLLKNIIENGLKLDYSIINHFADDQFREENLSFGRCFQMVFDMSHFLEIQTIDLDIEHGNWNGVSQPCKYYSLYINEYQSQISDDDIIQLDLISKTYTDLFNFLN